MCSLPRRFFTEKSRLCFIISISPGCVWSPVCSLFGKITQIYGRDANNILSYCKKQMNKSPCQDASAPLPGPLLWNERERVCVCAHFCMALCVCTLICASAQACICEFVRFILNVLWSRLLVRFFFQLIAVGFQWPDQAGGMQSVVKLNCNKLNVIQLRKISFPSSSSYLFRDAWGVLQGCSEKCAVDVHPTWCI